MTAVLKICSHTMCNFHKVILLSFRSASVSQQTRHKKQNFFFHYWLIVMSVWHCCCSTWRRYLAQFDMWFYNCLVPLHSRGCYNKVKRSECEKHIPFDHGTRRVKHPIFLHTSNGALTPLDNCGQKRISLRMLWFWVAPWNDMVVLFCYVNPTDLDTVTRPKDVFKIPITFGRKFLSGSWNSVAM